MDEKTPPLRPLVRFNPGEKVLCPNCGGAFFAISASADSLGIVPKAVIRCADCKYEFEGCVTGMK